VNHEQAAVRDQQDDGERTVKAGRLPRCRFIQGITVESGNALGYALVYKRLAKAVEHQEESNFALMCTAPDGFKPIPGCFNAVLTMWESETMAQLAFDNLSKADLVIAPTRWVAETARAQLPPHVAVEVAPLGVDHKVWKYKSRKWPSADGRPFRWLWNAAPHPRKGYPIISKVWSELFHDVQHCEFYVKTTMPDPQDPGRVERNGNLIFDSRRLPMSEYVDLYYSAHGFLYPSWGEGFGLTVAEAMASGLPVVSTAVTGHGDFVNEATAFVIDTMKADIEAKDQRGSIRPDGAYTYDIPLALSCAIQMGRVMSDYQSARKKARRAATLIHQQYRWDIFNRRIAEIIAKYS